MYHRCVNQQVVINEFRWPGCVCQNSANRPSHEVNILGPICLKPVVHRCLVTKI